VAHCYGLESTLSVPASLFTVMSETADDNRGLTLLAGGVDGAVALVHQAVSANRVFGPLLDLAPRRAATISGDCRTRELATLE
jgi:hypothetical protein